MNPEKRYKLYSKALNKWGVHSQVGMLYEELGELIVSINKYSRSVNNVELDKVIDEIADVEIMTEQYCYIFGIMREKIELVKDVKLNRLKEMLK